MLVLFSCDELIIEIKRQKKSQKITSFSTFIMTQTNFSPLMHFLHLFDVYFHPSLFEIYFFTLFNVYFITYFNVYFIILFNVYFHHILFGAYFQRSLFFIRNVK